MIAAMPVTNNSSLELFKLALTMIQSKSNEDLIPQTLTDYFIDILSQATSIAQSPEKIAPGIKPEVIELAVDIASDDDLLKELEGLTSFEKVTPDVASKILDTMEMPPVCQNGFSSFTRISG